MGEEYAKHAEQFTKLPSALQPQDMVSRNPPHPKKINLSVESVFPQHHYVECEKSYIYSGK